jgi:hypothetical protein
MRSSWFSPPQDLWLPDTIYDSRAVYEIRGFCGTTNGRIGGPALVDLRSAQTFFNTIAQRTMQRSPLETRTALPGLLTGCRNLGRGPQLQTKRAKFLRRRKFLKYAMVEADGPRFRSQARC